MPMTRIRNIITNASHSILNMYFTAGFPTLESTPVILKNLQENNVDLIEIGIPYSDPLADGKTIQDSSATALKNGMTISLLFEQIKSARQQKVDIPIILMGYYNQMLQYGMESFLSNCRESGVDGLIIPDLPMDIYKVDYQDMFENFGIGISFLITPHTSDDRVLKADLLSSDFIYMVSQSSITGKTGEITKEQINYFERIQRLKLRSPKLIGFGIHDSKSFDTACTYAEGAIVGSAFIRQLADEGASDQSIQQFVARIRQLN
jgi:tryptophan synthase alpha chain